MVKDLFRLNINSNFWVKAEESESYVRGTAFCNGVMLTGKSLADEMSTAGYDPSQWSERLRRLNGHYAAISLDDARLLAAVDRVRSYPLFYAITNHCAYLSDDAEWLRRQVGATEMDPVAREEFQLSGYVTGEYTLFNHIRQIQAGEALAIERVQSTYKVETRRYYEFLHTEPDNASDCGLAQAFSSAAEASIGRLIEYANGRQIVIPLSGGYDSRLVAVLLNKAAYRNVFTFSYGARGNAESEYSRRIARSLGIPWTFIEYSNKGWRRAWETAERSRYQLWGGSWSSIPHMQDWLAVRELRVRRLVDEDCVLVPGHTGDFVSGGHIPVEAFKQNDFSAELLAETIWRKHYSSSPVSGVTKRPLDFWYNRILQRTNPSPILRGSDLANWFERWEWQERQAKFIVNSVRVYEFWKYDWWLPLWDEEFVRFWQGVHLDLRRDRWWYKERVEAICSPRLSLQRGGLGNSSDPGWARRMLSRHLINRLPRGVVGQLRSKYSFVAARRNHLRLLGRYPRATTKRLIEEGYDLRGIYIFFLIRELDAFVKRESR